MEIKEVNLKRYVPGKDEAIKFTIRKYNHYTKEMEDCDVYSDSSVMIDINDATNIQVISIKEYNDYIKSHNVALGTM
ncbi:MAG: hypothetical protein HDQ88_04895 [Clostridia bacterium]|nr:hypothetical protein [Clostridia bacterium]